MLSVSIRQFEYAVAVAEEGSVSAAASALHVSQPALSVAVAGLEEHLGQPLFIRRKGSPVVLTSFGRGFIDEARKVLASIDHLLDPSFEAVDPQPVVIGCFEDLAPLMLAPILSRFRDSHPQARISTRIGGFQSLSEDLQSGRVDFAITYDLGLDTGFDKTTLAELLPGVLISPAHAFSGRSSVSLAELSEQPLVLAGQSLSVRHMIDLFQQRGLDPNIAHVVETLEILRSFVSNGLGVGLSYTLPRTANSYDGKPLRVIGISDGLPPEPVIVTVNRANPPSAATQRMIDDICAMRLF